MDLQGTKILVLFLLAIISLTIGIVPMVFGRRANPNSPAFRRVMSCILCAGGGVLLALCFTHIIPETREGLEANVESGSLREVKVPLCEVAVCMGFFFIYLVEEIVHQIFGSKTDFPGHDHNHGNKDTEGNHTPKLSSSSEVGLTDEERNVEMEKQDIHVINTLRTFLMVLALSFHGIMEGIMVGVADETSEVWMMFAAVGLHKYAIIFCLSVEMLVTETKLWLHLVYIFVYGLISSVGMAAGMGIYAGVAENNTDAPVINILQAIAAGTLIYVAFFEVLLRERAKPGNGLLKLFCVLIGFGVLLTISSCLEDE